MNDEILDEPNSVDERLRIHVPQPDTELVIGKGDNNFVGIMGRVHNGGVFFGAGGYPLGIPSADSSYEGFKKAHTTIGLGISGLAGAALFARSFYLRRDLCAFDAVLNGVALAVGSIPGTIGAARFDGTASAEGNVSLYGDSGVSVASPLSFSATAGLAASVNGSLASLNGVVAASVNATVVSLNGIKTATVSALETNVVGDAGVTVAARKGTLGLHAKTIEVGRASGLVPGQAYSGFTTGGQTATDRVDVKADWMVNIEPGKATDKIQGAPTKLQVTPSTVRAETKKAALQLGDEVALHTGSSVLTMGPSGMKLFHAATPIKDAVDAVVGAAEKAWWAAYEAADAIHETVQSATYMKLGTAIGAGAVGIPAALAGTFVSEDPGAQGAATGGLAAAGVAVGAITGGLATAGVVALVERKLSAKARDAAKKAADIAYENALKGAITAEKTAIKAASKLPTNPAIEVTADGIVLSVGTSKIEIKATGIEITTAPGGTVKVNGQTFANGGATVLSVGA